MKSSSSRLQCFEYWFSIFTKVCFLTSVSPQQMSSWPAHMFPPPDMLQKCVLSLRLSFHLPTPWRIHVTGSYICLPKGLPKFKVSNSDLYEIGNEKETGRSYFFLLNCSKEKILHGICPETCRRPVELSMNSPLGLIVKKWPVLQLGTLHFPQTLWLCFPSSSSSLSMISPPELSSCPYFLSLFLGSQEHSG